MILRLFAKVHARSRRRFFRFQPWQRVALLMSVGVLVMALAWFGIARHVAQQLPWFNGNQRVYLTWTADPSFKAHASVMAEAFAQVSSIDAQEWMMVLDAVMQTHGAVYGLVIETNQPLVYVRQPNQGLGVLPEGWQAQSFGSDQDILAIGKDQITKPPFIATPWWSALPMRALQGRFAASGLVQETRFPPVYMAVSVQADGWNVFASPSSGPIRHALIESATELSYPHVYTAIPTSNVPSLMDVAPIWQATQAFPATMSLIGGQWSDVADPLRDSGSWQVQSTLSLSDAQTWLQIILDELMLAFPLAEQRVLPDRSVAYELKRKPDFFLPANTTLDLITYPNGVLTYPRGQITYTYGDGQLTVQKGEVLGDVFLPACQLDGALAAFSSTGQAMGMSMWKSLFVGLDKSKIVACVRW